MKKLNFSAASMPKNIGKYPRASHHHEHDASRKIKTVQTRMTKQRRDVPLTLVKPPWEKKI